MLVLILLGMLFAIEFSKIRNFEATDLLNLDEMQTHESGWLWDEFYKVRVRIEDGQRASFKIPNNLKCMDGQPLEIIGAAVFFGSGCQEKNNKIAIQSFFLYPTLGLANACEHLPEVSMRWTILVNLEQALLLSREEMIQATVKVKGKFRIDTSKPYDAAFFLDNSAVNLLITEGHIK